MDRFEKEIKNKLDHFESMPPDELWDRIENDLDKGQPDQRFVWYKVAAAVLVLVVSVFSAWIFLPSFFTDSKRLAQEGERNQPEVFVGEEDLPGNNAEEYTSANKQNKEIDQGQQKSTLHESSVDAHGQGDQDSHVGSAQSSKQDDYQILAGDSDQKPVRRILRPSESDPSFAMLPSMGTSGIKTRTADLLNLEEPAALAYERREVQIQNLIGDPLSASPNGFSLSAFVMPQESYRIHNSNSSFPFSAMESDVFSFGAGIHVGYALNKKWKLRTGLAYTRLGQKVNDIAAFTHPSMMHLYSSDGKTVADHPQSMTTSMGGIRFTNQSYYFADVTSARIFTLKGSYDESNVNLLNKTGMGLLQHFDYLEIPFIAQYNLFNSIFSLDVKAGVNANFLLSGNVYLQGSSYFRPVGKSTGHKTFNLSGSTGLVASYPLGDHINLEIEPTFSMFLSPMGKSSPYNHTYPYNYSLMIGFSYGL